MLRRLLTENLGLKLLAFFLAVGLVYVQARGKITQQRFTGIQVGISNLPENMVYAVPDRTYTTDIVLEGPQNILNWLQPKDLRFTLDLARYPELAQTGQMRVQLGNQHFTPNLDDSEARQLTVSQEDISPSQVLITVHPWNIAREEPPPVFESEESEDVVEISLYMLTKDVPVQVLTTGEPPAGYVVSSKKSIPGVVTLTGPKPALEKISKVTTTPINVTSLNRDFLTEVPLPEIAREDSPVSATITRVKVELKVTRIQQGG